MRDTKGFDFKPTHLTKLRLRVEKLVLEKKRENKKIFKKLKNIFRL
jgi:hypothetical protein